MRFEPGISKKLNVREMPVSTSQSAKSLLDLRNSRWRTFVQMYRNLCVAPTPEFRVQCQILTAVTGEHFNDVLGVTNLT